MIPKGNAIYSYYGLSNPKIKQEKHILEIHQGREMSHFKFNDVSKLLPFTESACPESQCYDSLQILVKMSMHQETEYKKSNKTWFQLDVPETMSISDVGSLK